tara:strand:+ start:281 stop:484 length:204 start_codon:yes stop_codon:yes gene_type:complete
MTRKKTHFFLLLGLTFPDFSGIIFEVSERNTMKNEMTISEIRRHFELRRARDAKRLEAIKKLKKSSF